MRYFYGLLGTITAILAMVYPAMAIEIMATAILIASLMMMLPE